MNIQILDKIIIRYAEKEDLPDFEWGGKYTKFRTLYREVYKSSLENKAILWVVEDSDVGVVGQLFVQLVSSQLELADGVNRAYLFSFRIYPNYRNMGIGTKLLKIAEEQLIVLKYRYTLLHVNRQNDRAKRFYERNGYRVIASVSGRWSFYDNNGRFWKVNEPSWRMQKALLDD